MHGGTGGPAGTAGVGPSRARQPGVCQRAVSWCVQHPGWSAALVWGVVIVAITIRVLVLGDDRKGVYDVFQTAGELWGGRGDTYDPGARYRYPPVATVFFHCNHTPGVMLGSLFWRWLNIGAYLGAIAWALREGFPARLSRSAQGVLWILLVLPSLQSLRNGQANGLMTGALLAAAVWFAKRRQGIAAWLASVAVGFKVFPLAFAMCLGALSPRRFLPAFLLALGVLLVLPYTVAPADYVTGEYRNLVALLTAEDRTMDPNDAYRDLRLVLFHLGAPISAQAYQLLQVLAGGAIAGLALVGHRLGWKAQNTAAFLLTATSCWMLVFGFSAEQATYILTTPMLCWGLLWAHQEQRRGVFWFLVAVYLCYLFPILAGPIRRDPLARSILPASTLIAGAWLGWLAFRDVLARCRALA